MNFFKKIAGKFREWEVRNYAKSLVFAIRAAIFNAKSKNPNLSLNDLIKMALSNRNGWKLLETKNGITYFIYKDSEKIEVRDSDSFADIVSDIANVEICNMYFSVINKNWMSIKESGKFMLKGLSESEMVEKIIREEINKYSEKELQHYRDKER